MSADLKPCPFCGAQMTSNGSMIGHAEQSKGNCILSAFGLTSDPQITAAWNRLDLHEAAVAAARAEGMREAARIVSVLGTTSYNVQESVRNGPDSATEAFWTAEDAIIAAAEASK